MGCDEGNILLLSNDGSWRGYVIQMVLSPCDEGNTTFCAVIESLDVSNTEDGRITLDQRMDTCDV